MIWWFRCGDEGKLRGTYIGNYTTKKIATKFYTHLFELLNIFPGSDSFVILRDGLIPDANGRQ